MAIVLTSTTEPQENLDHAASEKWREAPKPKPEPAPEPEAPEQEPVEAPEPPSEPDVPAEEPETETETEAETTEEKHKRGGTEKRIGRLTKEKFAEQAARIAAEARAEALERENAQLRGEAPARIPDLEPKLEEYEARGQTKDDWAKDTRLYARKMAELDQRGKEILKTGQKKYSDWTQLSKQISENDIRLPDDVNLEVNKVLWDEETENPEDIIHYLWANPEEGKKLAAMAPESAARFVVRLGAKLAGPADSGKTETKPKAKIAPPAPITPVQSTGTKTSVPLEQMSMRDFIKTRNKQEIAKRKGL